MYAFVLFFKMRMGTADEEHTSVSEDEAVYSDDNDADVEKSVYVRSEVNFDNLDG